MAEITLADYTGYIFLELIRAREMADRHSRALAQVYAQDPILQHFSVPRFKIPKMELTIPVLISGARFNQVITFKMPGDKFVAYINGRMLQVISALRATRIDPFVRPIGVLDTVRPPVPRKAVETAVRTRGSPAERAPSRGELTLEFHRALTDNPDPSQPGNIVQEYWTAIFEQGLTEQDMLDVYKKANPNNELLRSSTLDVLNTITTNTVVDRTAIQSLLINPETNVVKNGSSDTSVFTIRADMVEEGFFIRQITDDSTGQTRPIVEFE